MEAERESVRLAVPFAAGVAAANYSLKTFYPGAGWAYAAASLSVAAFAALWAFCCLVNGRRLKIKSLEGGFTGMGLFRGRFLLGMLFAIAGAGIFMLNSIGTASPSSGPGQLKAMAGSCAESLRELIDTLPFNDRSCNGLMKAFLTGDRSGLDSHIRTIFRQSGASHLLALSGMHLGIIYLLLARLLSFTGNVPAARKIRSVLIVAGAGFFTIMTGASASIVRAFLFILLSETARLSGRKADGAVLLSSALMLQLAFNPGIISSISFQLSYLAMAGIVTVCPVMQRWWPRDAPTASFTIPGTKRLYRFLGKIWDLCALSISCQLFTGPLAWITFGTFPQYFLLTNLLCIPLMSLAMFSSIAVIAMYAAGICPDIALAFCEHILKAMIFTIETISSM